MQQDADLAEHVRTALDRGGLSELPMEKTLVLGLAIGAIARTSQDADEIIEVAREAASDEDDGRPPVIGRFPRLDFEQWPKNHRVGIAVLEALARHCPPDDFVLQAEVLGRVLGQIAFLSGEPYIILDASLGVARDSARGGLDAQAEDPDEQFE